MRQLQQKRLRVVIIGAGFGGMQAAQSLSKSEADILIIDRHNYNTFIPLLYQVAAAQIAPEMIAYPLRTIVRRGSRTRFLRAQVKRIDVVHQIVETDSIVVSYDYLVIATGSQTQYLGVPGAAEHALPLRTLEQAIALRNHIFRCFEQAAHETDAIRRQRLLTFVIVGGGPTGVEVAGTLFELKRVLSKEYSSLDLRDVQIVLVQSGKNLLLNLPERLGRYTSHRLRQLGVKVHLQTRVSCVTPISVKFQGGASLSAATVVWTAGLEAALPNTAVELQQAHKQKAVVLPTLQLSGHENVYAIGDVASVQQEKPLSGVAPEALQQGVAVARNISRQLRGKAPQPFRYFNKGRLAIIGGYSGVGKIGPVLLTGFLPWLMWLSVHLVYLPGFRNRLLVLLSWLHSYGFGDRAVRLILQPAQTSAQQRLSHHHSLSKGPHSYF
ncbi:MAG: NAD(P)/FAD-dependent oxidoreductase [Symploca sp. SIO2G7]|nr:NAD(P)/FAD-dependent oxidoreductase [Symploca sp. SIO2G7]